MPSPPMEQPSESKLYLTFLHIHTLRHAPERGMVSPTLLTSGQHALPPEPGDHEYLKQMPWPAEDMLTCWTNGLAL